MKKTIFLLLLPVLAPAQNAMIARWSFDTGEGLPTGSGTILVSLVGDPGTGPMSGGNTVLTPGFLTDSIFRSVVTSVPAGTSQLPLHYELYQNFPNPFNPATVIRYELPAAGEVQLVVYDLLGREVEVLLNEWKAPGWYETRFDASHLASGVYLYRFITGTFVESRKMMVIK